MTMKKLIIILALIAALSQGNAMADTSISASHEQAARDLIDLIGLEQQMQGGAEAMMDAMTMQSPELKEYRDVILDWANSIMTWDVFGPQMVEIYAGAFSESELRELIVFYKTPTGQKTITLLPELMSKGAQLGAGVAQENIGRLQKMIEVRREELKNAENSQE